MDTLRCKRYSDTNNCQVGRNRQNEKNCVELIRSFKYTMPSWMGNLLSAIVAQIGGPAGTRWAHSKKKHRSAWRTHLIASCFCIRTTTAAATAAGYTVSVATSQGLLSPLNSTSRPTGKWQQMAGIFPVVASKRKNWTSLDRAEVTLMIWVQMTQMLVCTDTGCPNWTW